MLCQPKIKIEEKISPEILILTKRKLKELSFLERVYFKLKVPQVMTNCDVNF